jgi:pimeloyl-ACP methyl ester carboxylesterase
VVNALSGQTNTFGGHSCRVVTHQIGGTPVVFLHGYSYTSEIWQRISVTKLLETEQIPFMALDMPYGAKSDCHPHSRDIEVNVAVINDALQTFFPSTSPVLVGASLGAHTALQFAARFHVKGLLLVGAVRVLEEKLVQAYTRFNFPIQLIVGLEDHIASQAELKSLADRLPTAKLTIYQNEGHSAYLGGVDRFKKTCWSFMRWQFKPDETLKNF